MERRGVFFLFSFLFLNFSFFPSTRDGVSFFIHFTPIKIIIYSFDALRPRGGPYFLLLQKVGKDRRKGVSPPCESPDQSGMLDAPLWKPPSLAALSGLAELLAACAAGASVPLGKARQSWRARARSPRLPHLHRFGLGADAPLPPRSPLGNVCRSCTFGGLRPLAPKVPKRGKFADHARQRMGPRPKRLAGNAFANLTRKLQPRSGEEFRHSPRAVVPKAL